MVIDIVETSDGKPTVSMSAPVQEATDRLKEFLFDRVYWNAATGNQDLRKSQHVIRALFRLYMEHPERMNGAVGLHELSTQDRALKVCDFIAGMTDRYAVYSFEKHFVPRGIRSGL